MKTYKIFGWIGLSCSLLLLSCSRDLGNYEYHAIDEVTIGQSGFSDTSYTLMAYIDTLRVTPDYSGTLTGSMDNYEFEWVAVGDRFKLGGVYVIGNAPDLVYPARLPEQDYVLYLRIKDKTTGVVTTAATVMSLKTAFSNGWLVLGENEEGFAQLDMVSILENDTLVIKNILEKSDLPALKSPTCLFIPTFGTTDNDIQFGTEEGTYKLNRDAIWPNENAHLKYSFFDMTSAGTCALNDAVQLYMFRAEILDNRLFYDKDKFAGKFRNFGNASNHYKGKYDLFKLGNKIGCNMGSTAMSWITIVCYDDDSKRFVFQGGGSKDPNGYCDTLKDTYGTPAERSFSWKTGQDFVTTINTRKAGVSTYTILKAPGTTGSSGYYLYGYNITLLGFDAKVNKNFKYQMSGATDIDKAEFYASSMQTSVIFYTVGNKLYGYDYTKNKASVLVDFDLLEPREELTMLWYDNRFNRYAEDEFYIGTSDLSKPVSEGGKLTGYRVIDDPNNIRIEEIPGASWSGLCKITSIGYKD